MPNINKPPNVGRSDGPPYRGGSNSWKTVSLFYERCKPGVDVPVFSLDTDIPGLINCRRTFVECRDLTGYKWAMKYLASWDHLERLKEIAWFRSSYESWQRELIALMQSEALARLTDISNGDTQGAGAAAKFIMEEGWNKPKAVRGRPSNATIEGHIKDEVRRRSVEEDDAERIGLSVIQGGKS